MGKGFQGAVLRVLGAKEHVVTVSGRDQLAEHFVRIHFRSGTLLRDGALHPDSWIRLWFPNPDNPSTLNQRGYTLVDPDPQAGTFAIDFVLHHPMGPASYWASRCEVGEELVEHARPVPGHPGGQNIPLPGGSRQGYTLQYGEGLGQGAERILLSTIRLRAYQPRPFQHETLKGITGHWSDGLAGGIE